LIPPICALFIESTEKRDIELACYKPFTDFLTEEILSLLLMPKYKKIVKSLIGNMDLMLYIQIKN
jgi:hypothetical protein